eukprot:gnl/TRDRNA2_/TRDRNA2_194297_c0_seq1.p1 gnl/TRDRNA2_/TRDRNA2_194297_c0~~gnl/TRDRNA2_/TRDRNA2_194297_c0_seq1.p1  ORF type:complete len:427 (-),score=79.17 gnl/TRDRNA2_/TRDRNA2_194297_c0_seq1:72-1352(-)
MSWKRPSDAPAAAPGSKHRRAAGRDQRAVERKYSVYEQDDEVQDDEVVDLDSGPPLHQLVADINSELITHGLPKWLTHAADKDLKKRAEDRGEYDDMMNIPGSCLFLAMLTPQQFGIDAEPLMPLMRHEDLLFISSTKSRSGKGIDNRRTNCLEALINDPGTHDELKGTLQFAWRMAYRAAYLQGEEQRTVDQFVLTRRIFACQEPLDDEDWWLEARRKADREFAQLQKVEVEGELQQDAQVIFERILPELKNCAERGEEISYKQIASAAGFEGHKGKTVRRLWTLWEAHCKENDMPIAEAPVHRDTTSSQGSAGIGVVKGSVRLTPAAREGVGGRDRERPLPRGSAGRVMQMEKVDDDTACEDRGAPLWERLTGNLEAEGLVVADLPEGEELTEVLKEMGFTAIQRMHLRKMVSQNLAEETDTVE